MRSLLVEFRTGLKSIGFEYRGRSWYDKRLNTDLLGVVTLASNSYLNDPAIYIVPSVGVTHEPLEKLLAQLSGRRPGRFLPATISTPLGYVTPMAKFLKYTFDPRSMVANEAETLLQTIERFGVKWMESNQSLDLLMQGLVTYKYASRDRARLRIPLIYYVKKDYASARASITDGLREIGEERNQYSDEYRQFAAGLLKRLATLAQ